jgi:luciferase family oxidoreductase group 1
LHPGRIDLGIGRAPGSDGRTALALRGSREGLNADDFPQQLAELLAFSGQGGGFPIGHPFRTVRAEPSDVELPPIWLLGSSDFGAQVAAAMGVGFAFAHHINAGYAVPAIKMYRNQFISSERMPESKVILAASAVCAETDERAEELASSMRLGYLQMRSGRLGPLPSLEEARAHHYTPAELAITKEHQQIIGRPEVVRKQLLKLVEQTGADELMITAVVYGYENRAKTFELLADALDLQSPPKAASTENIPS